jgi:hypothetical protein
MCEGVIKFQADHRGGSLSPRRYGEAVAALRGWRRTFFDLGLIGQDPARYEGAGFGNLSTRVGPPSAGRGRRGLLITGTQTGGKSELGYADYCVVHTYEPARNRVSSEGPCLPSSETLTHARLYDLSPSIRAVFHVHAPRLWRLRHRLRLPTTDADIPYGTQAMALAVEGLYRSGPLPEVAVLAMGGHEDGIISFGKTADDAGRRLITMVARAYSVGADPDLP